MGTIGCKPLSTGTSSGFQAAAAASRSCRHALEGVVQGEFSPDVGGHILDFAAATLQFAVPIAVG